MSPNFWDYLRNNLSGNTSAGTNNVLPAVLTTWSNLLSLQGNKTEYDLYKEQARTYVDNAERNAELIRNRGEIALRNLRYKNILGRGSDIATVGSTSGNMSGSNMDVILRKEKIRKMDEQTLNANIQNQVMLAMYNGYQQASNAYKTLSYKVGADRNAGWASIFKGIETYIGLSVRDAKIEEAKRQGNIRIDNERKISQEALNKKYGVKHDTERTVDSFDINPLNTTTKLFDNTGFTKEGTLFSGTTTNYTNDEILFGEANIVA